MLHSSANSGGEIGTVVVPANRSLILADSRFRSEDKLESPYDFNCDLAGTGIYAKEVYYTKLYWSQPLFSHNNQSAEIRFRITAGYTGGVVSDVYVAYATPYVLYTSFDGNAAGTSLGVPQPFSYAYDIEAAFQDVRFLSSNMVNAQATFLDVAGNPIIVRFRYSPTKGFVMYPEQPVSGAFVITMELLPCSWINVGHNVHGFGIFDENLAGTINQISTYIPRPGPFVSYWSDSAPTLLYTRYVIVASDELNKDRRLMSFSNVTTSQFFNELAILSVNYIYSGVYHGIGTGDDTTVVSLRDDYTPQSFRIQMLDESGDVIVCDDPLNAALTSPLVPFGAQLTFLTDNRGNHNFTNTLIFGPVFSQFSGPYSSVLSNLYNINDYGVGGMTDWAAANPMRYYFCTKQWPSIAGQFSVGSSNFPFGFISFGPAAATTYISDELPILGAAPLPYDPSFGPKLAFNSQTTLVRWNGNTPTLLQSMYQYTRRRKNPRVSLAVNGEVSVPIAFTYIGPPPPGVTEMRAVVALVMYQYDAPAGPDYGRPIAAARMDDVAAPFVLGDAFVSAPIGTAIIAPVQNPTNILASPAVLTMVQNPDQDFINSLPDVINVVFAIRVAFAGWNSLGQEGYAINWTAGEWGTEPSVGPGAFTGQSALRIFDAEVPQTAYIPPTTNSSEYVFGNPLATALCEEVIHEITTVLEYS